MAPLEGTKRLRTQHRTLQHACKFRPAAGLFAACHVYLTQKLHPGSCCNTTCWCADFKGAGSALTDVVPCCVVLCAAGSDDDFEASVLSDSILDRKPRKRSMNLALGLDELYKGGTKKLKASSG